MLGYSGFREVAIWVQTKAPAIVKVEYWQDGGDRQFTTAVTTSLDDDLIAKLFPHNLEYGGTYNYLVYVDDKVVKRDYETQFHVQELWQFRKDPPEFTIAMGSCSFINEASDDRPTPYGGGYDIFNAIAQDDPDLMLWMGDNMYLRTPDFLSERGIRHRYRHTRSTPQLQRLLATTHNYATWDDHDYGPNDSDRSYALKNVAEEVFNDYWANLNTNVVGNGGVTQHFVFNDIEFFMLDDRTHRAPNRQQTVPKDYLGQQQLDWLIDALTASKASFKIVINGGQVISNAPVYENYATYPEERLQLLDRLHKEQIEGVLFLSGDRHHTEISRLEREYAYPLIDITCSPLTAGTHAPRDEGNTLQVKDKTFYERNYGLLEVTGKLGDRKLVLTINDQEGNKVFDYKINQQDLTYRD
jgi:alkaline phosphatase D